MWGRRLDDDLDDYLRRELDLLVPTWSPEGEWLKVLERASSGIPAVSPGVVRGGRSEADTSLAGSTPKAAKTRPTEGRLVSRDRRHRSAFAYAAISFAVLVLLAGLGTGIFEAVTHLGKDQPILVITDDTLSPATTGQTTQTTKGSTASTGAWQQLPVSVEGGAVNTLVMDPADPAVLYAGTDEGLFKSTDGAANWTQLSVAGRVTTISVDPGSPSTVYVSAGYDLYRSLDGGLPGLSREAGPPGGNPGGRSANSGSTLLLLHPHFSARRGTASVRSSPPTAAPLGKMSQPPKSRSSTLRSTPTSTRSTQPWARHFGAPPTREPPGRISRPASPPRSPPGLPR